MQDSFRGLLTGSRQLLRCRFVRGSRDGDETRAGILSLTVAGDHNLWLVRQPWFDTGLHELGRNLFSNVSVHEPYDALIGHPAPEHIGICILSIVAPKMVGIKELSHAVHGWCLDGSCPRLIRRSQRAASPCIGDSRFLPLVI